jgi:hypothetical protein
MKFLDVANMILVHRGVDWPIESGNPSSKGMISHLIRNERLVTWLQPSGKGPEAQIPALCVGGIGFYPLSVRMMKAIWRRVFFFYIFD